ncbi:MAG: enoyl-CoA hydratase/isomerase family protein [Pseudomonadales bacterium]
MILFETIQGVAWITLNRPRCRNAMNREMLERLEQALAQCAEDSAVKAVVIRGASPAFCAGSDLNELGQMVLDDICALEARKAAMLRSIALLDKPVIASVEGAAVGGGCFLAAACDIVVATENARFQCMEVPNGWITPWGLFTLNARMSPQHAKRVAWGYEPINGAQAVELGLADYVVTLDELAHKTAEIAAHIAAMPAQSTQATKRCYQPQCLGGAQVEDAHLNALFRAHCMSEESQATLQRFAK